MSKPSKTWFSPSSEMAYLLYLNAFFILLWCLHVVTRGWFLGFYFAVLIPLVTVKAFADYRRKGATKPPSISGN
jgi:hypothetical protein